MYYLLLLAFALCGCAAAKEYVAPGPAESMPAENQQYLIGVISTLFVGVAAFLGIKALMDINYDDDTLLMVEVPEDAQHDMSE